MISPEVTQEGGEVLEQAAGDRRWAAGGGRQAAGDGRREAGVIPSAARDPHPPDRGPLPGT